MDDYLDKDKEFDNLEETVRKLVSMKIYMIGLVLLTYNNKEIT